jgi:hypothetical protein
MQLKYKCRSLAGMFHIGQSSDGRFHPIYNGEDLGSYESAQHAVEDLAGGHTFGVNDRITGKLLDTSKLGIPADVTEWEEVK